MLLQKSFVILTNLKLSHIIILNKCVTKGGHQGIWSPILLVSHLISMSVQSQLDDDKNPSKPGIHSSIK